MEYEVAPYAFGATEVVLTWDELDGLLREGVRDAVEADTRNSDQRQDAQGSRPRPPLGRPSELTGATQNFVTRWRPGLTAFQSARIFEP